MTGWPEPPAVGSETDTLLGSLTDRDPGLTYGSGGDKSTLRRLLVDVIEEYGRHADLIREAVDGRVGEDPPGRPHPYSLA